MRFYSSRRIEDLPFPLEIAANEKGLAWVGLQPPDFKCSPKRSGFIRNILDSTEIQLKEYFRGHRKTFDIPLDVIGTEFQRKVWRELLRIPYGNTLPYSQIAANIGCPHASRAVGMACNRNPIMIIIPCHRVIGKNGSLVGYAGGVNIKEYLLKLESLTIKKYEK